MAPEQWGAGPVDGRTDLWAVGIMLYQMVTGEHPLAPLSPERSCAWSRRDEPMPSVRERLPEIGRLGAVIDRCLLKPKADRLGSARELCDELEAIARPRAARRGGGGRGRQPLRRARGVPGARRGALLRPRDARSSRSWRGSAISRSSRSWARRARASRRWCGRASSPRSSAAATRGRRSCCARARARSRRSPSSCSSTRGSARAERPTRRTPRSDPLARPDDRDAIVERLRQRARASSASQMRARARRRRERSLLFVDQFEEVYTLAPEDEREAFLACLAGAADDASSPLRVVVSIRHDFLDRVASSAAALAELVSRGTVLVGPLDRRGLRSALVAPAEALAHRFESEALVDEMLDALAGAASALPLLQFTAAKLWEARDRERRLLTEASYRAFGGVGGALASHADSVLGALSSAERRCGARAAAAPGDAGADAGDRHAARALRARRRDGGGARPGARSARSRRGSSRWRAPAGTRARSSWCTSR